MKNLILKRSRIIIAVVFFVLTGSVFLGIGAVNEFFDTGVLLYMQFTPSLLKYLVTFGLSATGFAVVIVLTTLFGRIYCSAICPLGILQDVISRIARLFREKSRYRYSKPYTILRNTVLAITLVAGVAGFMTLVNLLDPYSLFGKIATGLFRPPSLWINNLVSSLLESINIYSVSLIDQPPVSLSILFAILSLITIIYLAGRWGRLYCNTICPVGTLLGWLSKVSLFKIRINASTCSMCGKCSMACKSECISIKDLSVDHSRCVGCFNCLPVCKEDAISFSPGGGFRKLVQADQKKPSGVSPDHDGAKRSFLKTSVLGLAALSGIQPMMAAGDKKKPLNKKPTTVPIKKTSVPSPPGSLSIGHFNSVCTACQLCVSHCPTGVLQPSLTQFGIGNFMQVFMDYGTQYCNFECVVCSEVCPTGAILKLDKEAKKTCQIGKVTFIKENCVVYTEDTACGSCSEHCPTQAVKMVPYKKNITIPEVDNTICIGCGACEYACPVRPFKAIYVDGNLIHEVAKKPVKTKLEEPQVQEEFPF